MLRPDAGLLLRLLLLRCDNGLQALQQAWVDACPLGAIAVSRCSREKLLLLLQLHVIERHWLRGRIGRGGHARRECSELPQREVLLLLLLLQEVFVARQRLHDALQRRQRRLQT